MYRTHTCGELTLEKAGERVTLCGWVQTIRKFGGMTFVDLRDRYGITQLSFNEEVNPEVTDVPDTLGREFVIEASGEVVERSSKNPNLPTGEVEVVVRELTILNAAKTPPFTIETDSDGGEELRMKYRYLDLRRDPLQQNLKLRHQLALETRKYLDSINFMEIETPVLIKSTPEGARDFVVPSRMHPGEFYALPQSPQTFKQILMVAGYDRYFQIVRCFRDEDLRADRQPEFTQIDCEMAFVRQEDVLSTFEGLTRHLFREVKDIELTDFPTMTYADAMKNYGSDKPDIRFGMTFKEITELTRGKDFKVFDAAELIVGIAAPGCATYSRKQIDKLTDFVKKPQIGAKGLVYVKVGEAGEHKSSVDKFYGQEDLQKWVEAFGAEAGDLLLILAGAEGPTRKALNELRLEMGNQLGLRNPQEFAPLWVVDFPLLEWDEESQRYHAMHHPFTSPKEEDIPLIETDPGAVRANAYDLVMNGVELGGGSIRIHDRPMQEKMFDLLGFTPEEARAQFGFIMDAFEYGAPPHGGMAFGFDRVTAITGGAESIRDFIAFPKNNAGRDTMIESPSPINPAQLDELGLNITS